MNSVIRCYLVCCCGGHRLGVRGWCVWCGSNCVRLFKMVANGGWRRGVDLNEGSRGERKVHRLKKENKVWMELQREKQTLESHGEGFFGDL